MSKVVYDEKRDRVIYQLVDNLKRSGYIATKTEFRDGYKLYFCKTLPQHRGEVPWGLVRVEVDDASKKYAPEILNQLEKLVKPISEID